MRVSPLLCCPLLFACTPAEPKDTGDPPQDSSTPPVGDSGDTSPTDSAAPDTGASFQEPVLGEYRVVHSFSHTAHQLSAEGGHLFLLDNGADQVLVFNTESLEQVGSVPTGDYPYMIESGDGFTVATAVYDWTATVIDSASGARVDAVRVGEYPWGLGVHQGQFYTTFITAADPYVQPVSLGTLQLGQRFDGESGPDNLAGAGDLLVLVNQRSMFDADDDALSIYSLDGTLVDSRYDWKEIRRTLGVDGPSIIDALNSLPPALRKARWRELEAIEGEASRRAALHEGARELVDVFREAGLATALVTNNSGENTRHLLQRLGLELDLVLTRDSGFFKPSGAPLTEAARRLGVPPEACLAVGDSRYDLDAAREAGMGRICLLRTGDPALIGKADMYFPDIPSFLRYLRSEP